MRIRVEIALARSSLLREQGRDDEALAADLRALELTANGAERRLLAARAAGAGLVR